MLVPFTTVKVIRNGQKEIALEISGGLFAGAWTITLAKERLGSGQMHLTLDLGSQPPETARDTLRVVRALVEGDQVTLVPLDDSGVRLPIGECELEYDFGLLDAQDDLLRHLAVINQEFREALRCPDSIDDTLFATAWTLATAISFGRVILIPDEAIEGEIPGDDAARCAERWVSGEAVNIREDGPQTLTLLERKLDVGLVRCVYRGVRPADPEWKNRRPGSPMKVKIDRIDRLYPRWFRRPGTSSTVSPP